MAQPESWWRNVSYADDKAPICSLSEPDVRSPSVGEIGFAERIGVKGQREKGNDLWLELTSGGWVLARSAGVVRCMDMGNWQNKQGRITAASDIYGQKYPARIETEGFAGSAKILVVSAPVSSLWNELTVEMLCRDIGAATLHSPALEGDQVFQEWVAHYAMNLTSFGLDGARFVAIVAPTCDWAKFQDARGLDLSTVKPNVCTNQEKELTWVMKVAGKLHRQWKDVEFLTTFGFLRKYCNWTVDDCKTAVNKLLAGIASSFQSAEPRACATELQTAFWLWMEVFDDEPFAVKEGAALCCTALRALAMEEEGRPSLAPPDCGVLPGAWTALEEELRSKASASLSRASSEPLGASIQRVRSLEAENAKQAKLIKELEAQVATFRNARETEAQYGISAGHDAQVHMWSIKSGRLHMAFKGHEAQIWSVCLSPDKKYLFTTSQDFTAKMWEVATGACLQTFEHHFHKPRHPQQKLCQPNWACVSPSMKYLFTAVNDSTAKVWDIRSGKYVTSLEHGNCVCSVCISSDGKYLFTASDDRYGRKWEVEVWKLALRFDGKHELGPRNEGGLYSCWLSADDKRFFTASHDGGARMFDAEVGGEPLMIFEGAGEAKNVVSSPTEPVVFIGRGQEGKSVVQMYSIESGNLKRTFKGHTHDVTAMQVTADGKLLLSSSLDGKVIVWDISTGESVLVYQGHKGFVQGITFI